MVLHPISDFLFELLNIAPSWSASTKSGFYITLVSVPAFLILSMIFYFILRAIDKKNPAFNPKFTLSLSFTITSLLAFLISSFFFILFWATFNWEYFDRYILDLPAFLIPFSFSILFTLSFLTWFLLERRKKLSSKISSSKLPLDENEVSSVES